MMLLRLSLFTLFKDHASLSVIKSIDQRWFFLKVTLFSKTNNNRLEDETLDKRHLLSSLTLKKHHYLTFFL